VKVLVTGGAGFIGTHLCRKLLADGHAVSVVDNFSPQVHAGNCDLALDIRSDVKLIRGDVRDKSCLVASLAGQDAVIHLAAETGTGQSMYEVAHYEEVNLGGTALLLEQLVKQPASDIETVIVASSRAVYGEGRYVCAEHGVQFPDARLKADMLKKQFQPVCPRCSSEMEAVPTTEDSRLHPTSFYGLTKLTQEQMTLMFGRALGLRAFGLRFQNVYGPGQSLNNPYTGILPVFSNQARFAKPIYIFEDGRESRDFVYVQDVCEATVACLAAPAVVEALNVGSGRQTTVLEIAQKVVDYFGSKSEIFVNGAFRIGDVRHSLADLGRVRSRLGFEPKWSFSEGLLRFLEWSADEKPQHVGYEESFQEMSARNMYHA
jgi:dTDP-L-rhamnose 4-epimerase